MSRTLAALLLAGPAIAQTPPMPRFTDSARRARLEEAFPKVEKAFENYVKQRGVPGLVFGVVIDGRLALVKSFGVRDRASQAPVTPGTVFRIASMTKSFTALAVLKLRDEGKLSLDDPVSRWIPEFAQFKYPTRDTAAIRVRQLLTHSAGFPEDNPWGDRQLGESDDTLTHWLKAGIPFSTPPDTAYEYSNYGFALLGRIVSKASGVPYREYLEKQILAPLGMQSSTLEASAVPATLRATGYGKDGDTYIEVPSLPHGSFGAMGGLHTSANDLARYVAYQLSAWPPRDDDDRGPVRRSSLREMQQAWRSSDLRALRGEPDAPLRVASVAYGYGLTVTRNCRFAHLVSHGGGLPGFGSFMAWLPEYGVGMFAMANLTYAGPSGPVGEAFDILLATGALRPRQLPPAPALTRTRDAIVRLWQKWDVAEANRLAANNLFMDSSAENRRREIEKLKASVGQCRDAGDVDPENLLRGRFRMSCDNGFIEVTFTLAPTNPPTVQRLRFAQARTPETRMKEAATRLAMLKADESYGPLISRHVEAVRADYGSCRIGETLAGDGRSEVTIRLDCDRGPLNVSLSVDANGKLTRANFIRPPEITCAP